MDQTSDSFMGWYPVSIELNEDLQITWRNMGQTRFTEPFFEDTVRLASKSPTSQKTTSIEALTNFNQLDCLEPSAFIFHASRCGSTLATQLLTTSDQCIVLSEPSVLDQALTLNLDLQFFKQLIQALGQKRFSEEHHLVIKLDSWHISEVEFVQRAYPHIPFYFFYREPREILASHQRQRGTQMVSGMIHEKFLQIDRANLEPGDLDGYALAVLTQFYREALKQAEFGSLELVNYNQLPEFVWTQFAKELAVSFTSAELEVIKERAKRHSKIPHMHFGGDPQTENESLFEIDLAGINKLYGQLEALRLR